MLEDRNPLTTAEATAALRSRLGLLCLCALVVAASAVGFGLLREERFTATASLSFDQQPPSAAQVDALAVGESTVPPPSRSLAEVALREPVVASTASALGIDRDALAGNLEVKEGSDFGEVRVSATGSSGAAAATAANAYAERYVAFQNRRTERLLASGQERLRRLRRAAPEPAAFDADAKALRAIARERYGRVAVAAPASAPSSPSSPDLVRNAPVGLAVGLLLGAAIALGLESRNATAGAAGRLRGRGLDGRAVDA